MSTKKELEKSKRGEDGKFKKGVSGNPKGRPKGVKNRITLLKQSLEHQLRNEASEHMSDVLATAIELAKSGDRQMIKLLLDAHLSKPTSNDDEKAAEKVSISIQGTPPPKVERVHVIDAEVIEDNEDTEQAE